MDTDELEPAAGQAKAQDKGKEEGGEEAGSYMLENPTRVVPAQEQYITFDADERWEPLRRQHQPAGILMLRDRHPGAPSPPAPFPHILTHVLFTYCRLRPMLVGCDAHWLRGPPLSATHVRGHNILQEGSARSSGLHKSVIVLLLLKHLV